jgi:hypothetical protein
MELELETSRIIADKTRNERCYMAEAQLICNILGFELHLKKDFKNYENFYYISFQME